MIVNLDVILMLNRLPEFLLVNVLENGIIILALPIIVKYGIVRFARKKFNPLIIEIVGLIRFGIILSQDRDLNPGPAVYDTAALPTELSWQY